MSTHARPLAERLAAASDAQLQQLLRLRQVRPDVDWSDFFDAAEGLLEAGSIAHALTALTRDQALALRAAAAGQPADAAELDARGLIDAAGRVPRPVADAVLAQPQIPDATPHPAEPASAAAAARAAERAFTTIGALADLLLAARMTPLALVATGALSATEKRRLAETASLDELRELAEITGLARRVDRELRLTAAAEPWLRAPFAQRWSEVVDAFREALPEGIRSAPGWGDESSWSQVHPWDASWPARAARLRDLAAMLGLIAADGSEPEWAALVRTGAPVDAAALQALLPSEVDKVFLQNDLTAIAPGPLLPVLDNRLRAMTERAPAAQASTYRFTADSIVRALAAGESAASIMGFLREVSLTDVPQPLAYLVAQTAARHGLVRVGPDATGGTTVSSSDENLLEAIAIDRNLRPLGLVREADHLTSRVGAETVVWALTDARYPATLVDRDGAVNAIARTRFAPAAAGDAASHDALITRLRSRQGPDADAAWLDRELEAAVRARAVLMVEVAMPDGSSRELTLEASGMGGGRLRGRDRAADVERTLPVRSIRSVRVLQD